MKNSPRILCVEDHADTRELVCFLLNSNGFHVTGVGSQKEALAFAKENSFDLYIIDHWIPGGSGIELCKALRRFDERTPILFYSGAAYDTDKKLAVDCGAQAYLVKPVDSDTLLTEVLRLISKSQI